eukprot:TRINITY_DN8861_c0_g1_i12.p2 TRINITY_DN8861_c0_g1~~TRINITY_DN8861_c0_g1_i12.p2  ORF type:complete len:126 (-),score=1.58 TRINITY_DN8861_c0_g1_i12:178-555(-)
MNYQYLFMFNQMSFLQRQPRNIQNIDIAYTIFLIQAFTPNLLKIEKNRNLVSQLEKRIVSLDGLVLIIEMHVELDILCLLGKLNVGRVQEIKMKQSCQDISFVITVSGSSCRKGIDNLKNLLVEC